MARWLINVSGSRIRQETVEKIVKAITDKFGGEEKVHVSVRDATPPSSRSERFAAAMSLVSEAKEECESLRDELQEWFDNLPENFQIGDKGNELEEAIGELENAISNAEDLESTEVSFPGMY